MYNKNCMLKFIKQNRERSLIHLLFYHARLIKVSTVINAVINTNADTTDLFSINIVRILLVCIAQKLYKYLYYSCMHKIIMHTVCIWTNGNS